MTTVLKYSLILIAFVIGLAVLAALAVTMLVDPNDYRDDIAQAVEQQTGRNLQLDGEIDLRVFPCCSLGLGAASLGNPAGWPAGEFVKIDSASVSLRLLPLLLRQDVQAGEIALDGLVLNLVSRRDGSTNWELTSTAQADEDDASSADRAATSESLAIAGVRISNATVSYRDELAGDDIRLTGISLSTGEFREGRSSDISAGVAAEGLLDDKTVSLELKADAILDSAADLFALENIRGRLDDTAITGWVRLASISAQRLELDLQLDRLDADAYLGDDDQSGENAAATGTPAETDTEIPVGALRSLNLDGNIAISELIYDGARLNDVGITAKARGGLVRLHPLTAELYGGRYAGDTQLDVRGRKPKLSVNEELTGVMLSPLLADTAEISQLAGAGTVRIKATAIGDTVDELLEQLSGTASFDVQDGLYQGIDLWYEIRKARALIKQTKAPAAPENPQTEFSEFSGTLNFADGLFRNPDLRASLPFMRLTGRGSFNALDSSIDYALQARVTETPTFGEREELGKLKGLALPVEIKGTLDAPRVKIDLGELAKDAAEQKLKDRLRKKFDLDEPDADPNSGEDLSEEQAEEPKDALKKKLRGLFD